LRARYGVASLAGIGIGVPGHSAQGRIIRNSNNPPFLEDFPFTRSAAVEHRHPENDANAAALGEKWMGAGREVDDLVLLTLGTGIGGGIISGGRVLRGIVGMAGELGHLTVVPIGNPCGCGNRGCLEKHASATAVAVLARLLNLGENLTAKDVYDLARQGNEKARRVWTQVGEALGTALAMLVNTFNFPLYLLSGGVLPRGVLRPGHAGDSPRRSFTPPTNTRIEQAQLGNLAGLRSGVLPWIEERRYTAPDGCGPV
jgi:glucokinase